MQISCNPELARMGARERRKFRYTKIVDMREARTAAPRGTIQFGYPELNERFSNDALAIEFVMLNPGGATVDEVAEALCIGKSTVDGLEKRAFRKLLARARAGDYAVREWLFALAQHVKLQSVVDEFEDCA
jgi:hypothetical protein